MSLFEPMIGIFNAIFFKPVVTLLVVILSFFDWLGIPGSLGFSVIILTLIIRLLVWPFMTSQIRSARKIAELKPRIDELKGKHKDNRQAFAQAQMALYKEHGVNPAGGCVPALIQLPVFIALANAIPLLFNPNGLDQVNELVYLPGWSLASIPDPHFMGFNLADKLSDRSLFTPEWLALMLVPLVTALLAFVQSKMMMHSPVKLYPSDSPKEKKEKVETEDAMAAMQSQMLYLMPVMIGVFAYQFPVGLSLYWNVFTIVGIIQQYLISGWGGLESWIRLLKRS